MSTQGQEQNQQQPNQSDTIVTDALNQATAMMAVVQQQLNNMAGKQEESASRMVAMEAYMIKLQEDVFSRMQLIENTAKINEGTGLRTPDPRRQSKNLLLLPTHINTNQHIADLETKPHGPAIFHYLTKLSMNLEAPLSTPPPGIYRLNEF